MFEILEHLPYWLWVRLLNFRHICRVKTRLIGRQGSLDRSSFEFFDTCSERSYPLVFSILLLSDTAGPSPAILGKGPWLELGKNMCHLGNFLEVLNSKNRTKCA